ncbi:MFS transporter [Robbsia sp. KACC 23696]|uniref:MFS transporter n=1 Tax=Robbsia sp. KACC 23696 TaxID=3149231 RepID=UPI00325B4980
MQTKTASPVRDGTLPLPSSSAGPVFAGVQRGSADYRRISLALFLSGFSTFSLLYCVQPLLPSLTGEFHIGAAQSSLALSLSTGFLAFSILCAGPLSERLGRRGLMFASLTLAALCNLLVSVAPSWNLILLGRALEGFVLGGVPAVAMAYLAEEINPKGLGMSMGLYVGGTAFGGMMGRVGMSFLTDWFSWRTAMATLGVIDLAAAIAFVLLLPPSRNFMAKAGLGAAHHVALWRRHLSHPMLPMVFGVGCLVMGAFVTVYNYAGFRLIEPPFNLNAAETGLIFSAYLFGMVASSVAGGMADRFGRGPVLVTGVTLAILGVLLTLPHQLTLVIVGIVLLTIGFFIAHSVASGWVGRLADGAKGHASSLYLLAYYLGSSFLGSAGGHFWEQGSWPGVAIFAVVLLALCLMLGIRLWRRTA